LQTALRSAFSLDARRLVVLTALVLAMIQARSVVLYTLKNHVQLSGTRAIRSQRLLRFVQFQLTDGVFTRFALSFHPAGKVDLILDRTNWKLGQQDVHILLLSAVWNGFALPLMWTLLPHGGSSSQMIRNALLERFLQICPVECIGGLLADRESTLQRLVRLSRSARHCALYLSSCSHHPWVVSIPDLGRLQKTGAGRDSLLPPGYQGLRRPAPGRSDEKCCWRDLVSGLSGPGEEESELLRPALVN